MTIFLSGDDINNIALACTGNDTLSGLGARDGVTPVDGQLCLAPLQTDQTTRGLYVARSGAWDRVISMRTGQTFRVAAGSTNAGHTFQLTTVSISPRSFNGSTGACATNLSFTDITGGASGAPNVALATGVLPKANGGLGQDASSTTANTAVLDLYNKVADGASAVVAKIFNRDALSNAAARLLSLGSNAVEKFAVLASGGVLAPTAGPSATQQHSLPAVASGTVQVQGAAQSLSGAGAASIVLNTTLLTTSGAGQVITLADGTYVGQRKRVVAVSGYTGTNTSVVTPATGTAVTLKSLQDFVEYEWSGSAWVVVGLRLATASYSFAGNNGAAARTATGAKVGDRVVAVMGWVTSTGVYLGLNTTDFEAVVTVANQIQQTGSNLSANTYIALVEPRS